MRAQDTLADGILSTKDLAARYFAGFDNSNRTRQAPSMPNHFAWNLGHLALTMHRAAERLSGSQSLPERDFVHGGTPIGGGDASRYATESVGFGSRPTDDPSQYPTFDRCVAIFNGACDHIASVVRALPDHELTATVPWGQGQQLPKFQMAVRMVFHNGDHVGQIADLRRAFGFKSIFG